MINELAPTLITQSCTFSLRLLKLFSLVPICEFTMSLQKVNTRFGKHLQDYGKRTSRRRASNQKSFWSSSVSYCFPFFLKFLANMRRSKASTKFSGPWFCSATFSAFFQSRESFRRASMAWSSAFCIPSPFTRRFCNCASQSSWCFCSSSCRKQASDSSWSVSGLGVLQGGQLIRKKISKC